ncbi:hypothetical protein ACDA27_004408 [Salmonella enterica]
MQRRFANHASRRCSGTLLISASGAVTRVLRDALDYLVALPLKERPVLMGAAAKRGYSLTLAEEEHALEAKDALLAELREKC